MLKERLVADLKTAMKAGETERVGTLRMVQAAISNAEIEKRPSEVPMLTEEETLRVLEKEAKKRREAAELYVRGGRKDLADKELREVAIIAFYLPPQASDTEIEAVVRRFHKKGGDFAMLMKGTMQELKGKAEGSRVSAWVKKVLEE